MSVGCVTLLVFTAEDVWRDFKLANYYSSQQMHLTQYNTIYNKYSSNSCFSAEVPSAWRLSDQSDTIQHANVGVHRPSWNG